MSKKILTALLAAVLMLTLCACGGSGETAEATPTPEVAQSTPTPTPEPTAAPDLFTLAQDYVDADVADLIAAIGEPMDSSYAPSCLGSGEDGELYYDGFTVYTYREGDTETVQVVLQ